MWRWLLEFTVWSTAASLALAGLYNVLSWWQARKEKEDDGKQSE